MVLHFKKQSKCSIVLKIDHFEQFCTIKTLIYYHLTPRFYYTCQNDKMFTHISKERHTEWSTPRRLEVKAASGKLFHFHKFWSGIPGRDQETLRVGWMKMGSKGNTRRPWMIVSMDDKSPRCVREDGRSCWRRDGRSNWPKGGVYNEKVLAFRGVEVQLPILGPTSADV